MTMADPSDRPIIKSHIVTRFVRGHSSSELELNNVGDGIRYLRTSDLLPDLIFQRFHELHCANLPEDAVLKAEGELALTIEGFNRQDGRSTIGIPCWAGRGLINNHVVKCEPRVPWVHKRYLEYAHATLNVTAALQMASEGAIAASAGPALRDISIPVPSMAEQRAIADYLDRETAQIDALIAAKQRMIDLLEERWQAEVSSVMDSPDLPRIAVRRVIGTIEQGWSPQCEARLPEGDEWCVLKTGAVNGMRFRRNEVKALPHDTFPDSRFQVHDGDILMSRANTKELIGSVGRVRDIRPRTLLCDKLFRLVPRRGVDADFFVLALQTKATRLQLTLDSSGASDSMQNIGQDTVLRLTIPVMPTESQGRISRQLSASHEHVEAAKAALAVTCDRLAERRTALITTAVTGALEIPGVAV